MRTGKDTGSVLLCNMLRSDRSSARTCCSAWPRC